MLGDPRMHAGLNLFNQWPLMLFNLHWLASLGDSATAFFLSFGGLGVMLLAMGDSSLFSFPEANDVLIVFLAAGSTWGRMAYFVGMTILGSVIGCLFLYMLGRKGGNQIVKRRFSQKSVERAERLFGRYGILAVIIPSILPPPTPFKLFVLSAGVFRLNPLAFLVAVVMGRTIRYAAWGVLAVLYGDSVKIFVQHNLKTVGILLFFGFMLAIAAAILFHRYRPRSEQEKI